MKATISTFLRLALLVSVAHSAWHNASGAITIVNPAGANHVPASVCPALDGANVLDPDPVVYLPPPKGTAPIRQELAAGDTPFPGWTFLQGAKLNGTLTIKLYKSVFDGAHYSGGDIEADYVPAATDPPNLHFIQLVTTTAPAVNNNVNPPVTATSPYIDPFPNDDNLPFYWTQAEETTMGTSLHFSDGSRRSHPPTSFVTWCGDLHLASWDGKTPGTVRIHDGIQWGWDAGCINFLWLIVTVTTTTTPGTCTLSWPVTAVPYSVESSPTLGTSARWQSVNGVVTQSNGQNHMVVTPSPSVPQQFYRLTLTTPPQHPPIIVTQPQSQTNAFGSTVAFDVDATGTVELSYQWWFNGTPIPGATDSTLTLSNASNASMGAYSVVVGNASGSVTSAPAMFMLQNCSLNITAPPRNTTNMAGSVATFSVTASGLPAPSQYQWQQRPRTALAFVNIPGATSATYSRPVTIADNGSQFRCLVGNGCATLMSSAATLTVSTNAGDTTPPALQSATAACLDNAVTVQFSEPVDPSSAANPFNYTLASDSRLLNVMNVAMMDSQTIRLVVDQPITPDAGYLLTVQGIRDLTGNTMLNPATTTFVCH